MEKQMSVGDWMVTYLLTSIPLVGFIMLFVWSFSSDTNPSKKTWAQATLIWLMIITVLYLILGAVFMAAVVGSM